MPDYAGGIAVLIQPLASPTVPEASPWALTAAGLLPLLGREARRRKTLTPQRG